MPPSLDSSGAYSVLRCCEVRSEEAVGEGTSTARCSCTGGRAEGEEAACVKTFTACCYR